MGSPSASSKTSCSCPPGRAEPPEVIGFVAAVQRRRIFVNANRVAELDSDGARLRSWDVDVNPFKPKSGELLVGKDIIDTRIGDETVSDVALRQTEGRTTKWMVEKVRLARRRPLVRRPSYRIVDWDEVPSLFAGSEMATEAARLRDMHPSDVADVVRLLPLAQRRQLAEAMEDDRLADLLEELPEAEQLRIIEGLDVDRLVSVLEEMEFDDLADLLAEMPGEQRTQLLSAMDVEDADVLRRLLSYEEGTAGSPDDARRHHLRPARHRRRGAGRGARPGVAGVDRRAGLRDQAPFVAPTGTYLGVVHFQRLLREPPSMTLGRCLEEEPTVPPDMPEREVAERLAVLQPAGRRRCATSSGGCSAPSPSTTCSTARCPADWRQRATRRDRS